MHIRRTTYLQDGLPVSLAYIEAIADLHPETVEGAPPSMPDSEPHQVERRGPRRRTPQAKRERGPAMTERFIRKVLRKPEPPRKDQAQYERTMRRVMREGV